MIDVIDIIKSWGKLFSNNKTENQIKLASERYRICMGCEFRTRLDMCQKCGCFLKAKVFTENIGSCPESKWSGVDKKYGNTKTVKSII